MSPLDTNPVDPLWATDRQIVRVAGYVFGASLGLVALLVHRTFDPRRIVARARRLHRCI